MLSAKTPCQDCQHKDICKYSEEACAAYGSLERGSYGIPEHGDRAPGDLNTCSIPYRASKLLTFTVHCKYYKGPEGLLDA